MILSGEGVNPNHEIKFNGFTIPENLLTDWRLQTGSVVHAVSVACGTPSWDEIRDLSLLSGKPINYIGYDIDQANIERALGIASRGSYQLVVPNSNTTFVHRDMTMSPLDEELEAADIALFKYPDVLGNNDREFYGYGYTRALDIWGKIVSTGLSMLKVNGLVVVVPTQSSEERAMSSLLKDNKAEMLYRITERETKPTTFDYGLMVWRKPIHAPTDTMV